MIKFNNLGTKKSSEKKLYTLEEIDKMIEKHKNGELQSLEIYKAFEGFIFKYVCFLKYARHENSEDIKSLMKILKISPRGHIYTTIFSSWDETDLFSELYCIFLKCLNYYKKMPGKGFVGYIYNYFKFAVKKWLKNLSADALNHVKMISLDSKIEEIMAPEVKKFHNPCLIDMNILNQAEKYVLYLSYIKKIRTTFLAKKLITSRGILNTIKTQARRKLICSDYNIDDFIES